MGFFDWFRRKKGARKDSTPSPKHTASTPLTDTPATPPAPITSPNSSALPIPPAITPPPSTPLPKPPPPLPSATTLPPRAHVSARVPSVIPHAPSANPSTAHASQSPQPHASIMAAAQHNSHRDEVLRAIEELPTLPTVITEIMGIVGNENTCAQDFEEPFRKDQAMTAKLLKLVNSSFYGLPNKITTVPQAIVILGYKTIKSLVLACSTSSILSRPVTAYGYKDRGLWEHSIATAGIARHLGMHFLDLKSEEAEELFVAGLLHNIGKIAIVPVLNRIAHNGPPPLGGSIVDYERELVGIDHVEVGTIITQKWKLDEQLTAIISEHHGNAWSSQQSALVTFANIVASRAKVGVIENYPWKRPISGELVRYLGINQEKMAELKPVISEAIKSSLELFGGLDS